MLSKLLSPNYVTLQVDSFSTHDCVQVVSGALPGAVDRDVMLCVEVRGPLSVATTGYRLAAPTRPQVWRAVG